MAASIPVEIDAQGRVTLSGTARIVGRTAPGRPPRAGGAEGAGESLEVRDRQGTLLGWVTAVEDLPLFELVPNRFYRGVDLDELGRLLDRYAATPSTEALFELTMAVRQVQGLEADLTPAEQRRLAALLGRLVDIVVAQMEASGDELDAAGAGGQAPEDLGLALIGLPVVLLQAGGASAPPVLPPIPLKDKLPPIQGDILSPDRLARLRDALLRLARRLPLGAVGPLALLLAVYGAVAWLVYAGAVAGAAAALRAVLRVAREVILGVLELFALAEEAILTKLLAGFGGIEAFRDCFDELLRNLQKAFDIANEAIGRSKRDPGQLLAQLIRHYVQIFIDCLIARGVPPGYAGFIGAEILRVIARSEVLKRFSRFSEFFVLSFGALIGGLAGGRNAARDFALAGRQVGRNGGYHRKGGFAYDEFDDDRAEVPDLSDEDPREDVDAGLVNVNPVLELDAFDCADLAQRAAALRRRLEELARSRDETVAEIRDLLAADPPDRVAIVTRIRALDEIRREIPNLALALRRTLAEIVRRPCPELTPSEIQALRDRLRAIERDTAAVSTFAVPGEGG